MRIFGLNWVPFSIPIKQRLEIASVLFYVSLFILFPILCTWFPAFLLFYTKYWWCVILYFLWIWYDRFTPQKGARRQKWWRNCSIWRHFRDYFPAKLHKTVELDPERNYIMGVHPHGVLAVGAFVNFGTDATGFSEKFPGITPHPMTLVGQFWFPIRRELILWLGGVEVSKNSISYLMNLPTKGHAVIIVVGGAMEVLDAKPGTNGTNLTNRKGFIKQALIHGADLVPIFSFGENDLYNQMKNDRGSGIRKFQSSLKRYMGVPLSFFYGRGIFNYSFGLLPFRRPVNTVGGVEVSKNSISYLMNLPTKGHAVIIVVGGAMEVLDAKPGTNGTNLTNRKGFIKQALIHGADLVPIFSFGENDLYNQMKNDRGSGIRKFQSSLKRYMGVPLSFFYGRGIFNYSFGLLPFRRPVNTVVGRPIRVEKVPNPTSEQVVELHGKYCNTLNELFEENKKQFGLSDENKLIIN